MVLIVDDDKSVRLSLSLMLSRAHLEHMAASTEAEALEAVRSVHPEVVILDMNLTLAITGRQGLEILRKIKILEPRCQVILISAWGTIPLAVEGMSLGAADFITKPWDNAEVVAKIRRLMSQREAPSPSLDDVERETLRDALRRSDGNLNAAARLLGITRQTLYRRLKKHQLK